MVGADAVNPISGLDLGASAGYCVIVTNSEIGVNNPYGDLYGIRSRGTEPVYYSDIILEVPMTGTELFPGTSPELMRDPATIDVECEQNGTDPADATFTVWNRYAASAMAYSISVDQAWLSVAPSSGSSSGEYDTMIVSFDNTGLSDGEYTATITISAPGAIGTPKTIAVTMTVTPPGPLHDYGDDFEPYPLGIITNANRICTPLVGAGYIRSNYIRSLDNDIDGGAIEDTLVAAYGLLPPELVLWNNTLKLAGMRVAMPGWETTQQLAVYITQTPGSGLFLIGSAVNPSYPVQWFGAKDSYYEIDCSSSWPAITWPHYYICCAASSSWAVGVFVYVGPGIYV